MNAMLTWWGVSIAILNHQTLGNAVVARETLLRVVPIFVAVMVWLIRVLIIGTMSIAGDRLFSQSDARRPGRQVARNKTRPASSANNQSRRTRTIRPLGNTTAIRRGVSTSSYRPSPKSKGQFNRDTGYPNQEPEYTPIEPTYTPVSMTGVRTRGQNRQSRF